MRSLELAQIIGIIFMFNLTGDVILGERLPHALFIAGSAIAYTSTNVWAGVCYSYCLKRAPGGMWSIENLLLLSQLSIFLGICFGSIVSRSVLGVLQAGAQQSTLAMMLLVGAALQLFFSEVAITQCAVGG